MKKKIVLLLVTALAVMTMAGCGKKDKDSAADSTTDSAAVEDSASADGAASGELLRDLDTSAYVTLGEYTGLTVTVDPVAEVTEDDVTNYINTNFLSDYAEATDITDRTLELGDTVNFECIGKIDGEVFDGGSTADGETWSTTIGSNGMIPDLENGMIGMAIGETKDIPCTFPEDYQNEEYAGKEAVFTITVASATKTTYPELTADILTEINSGYADVDKARQKTREYLEDNAQTTYDDAVTGALMSQVLSNCQFQTPPQFLVDKNAQALRQNLEYYASMYGMEFVDFLSQMYGMTEDDFTTQANTVGIQAANETIAIEAIADAQGISEVSDEELTAAAEDYIAGTTYYTDVESLFVDVDQDTFRDYVVSQRVQAWLTENNTVVTE